MAYIDLSEYGKKNLTNHNILITQCLDRLVDQIDQFIVTIDDPKKKQQQQFRARQINNASKVLKNLDRPVLNGTDAQKIKGIGKGIGNRIDEILKTGKLSEMADYQSSETAKIAELITVTGIGDVTARKLIEKFDVQGIDDLIEKWKNGTIRQAKNQLTHHMVLGLKYYEDLKHRIPREEIVKTEKKIKKICKKIDSGLLIEICGSYRRNLPTSGDIDILITHPDMTPEEGNKVLISLVNKLNEKKFLIDSLTDKGKTKYMGFCRINTLARRIDIRFIDFDSYAPAVLYFTGSKIFNTFFRARAIELGYTLNEYGLYHIASGSKSKKEKGEQIECYSEQDLFKVLRVKYLSPEERNL
jgi:DNA polymerase/3'-5' exonuclease PolX